MLGRTGDPEHRYFHNVNYYSKLEGEVLWLLGVLAYMTNEHGWGEILPDASYASFDPPDPSLERIRPNEIQSIIRTIERAGEIAWNVPKGVYRITVGPPGVRPKRDMPAPGYVYLLESRYGYKIGRTKDIPKRITFFGVKLPFTTKLLHTIVTADMVRLEAAFHRMHAARRIDGEWFDLSPQHVAEFCAIISIDPAESD